MSIGQSGLAVPENEWALQFAAEKPVASSIENAIESSSGKQPDSPPHDAGNTGHYLDNGLVKASVGPFKTDILAGTSIFEEAGILSFWREWLESNQHPMAWNSSPEYLGILTRVKNDETKVIIVRDAQGHVVGLAPVCKKVHSVKYDVFSKVLFRKQLVVTDLLGSLPLVDNNPEVLSCLLDGILDAWPESRGIHHDALPVDSIWGDFISRAIPDRKGVYLYSPFGDRQWHIIRLNSSFDNYIATHMSRRARQARRREQRKLAEVGELDIQCCDSESDPQAIERFLDLAEQVSANTWQNATFGGGVVNDEQTRREFGEAMAEGKLRSYSLSVGGEAAAFCVGHQAAGTYQSYELGFNRKFLNWSPGTVLMLNIVEDLHKRNPPKILNFGVGDSTYKRRFATWSGSDATVMVLRSSLSNYWVSVTHKGFLVALEMVKKVIGRKTKD